MHDVSSRDLRNDTAGVLRRVEAGGEVRITVHGRPVARLVPLGSRRREIGRDELLSRLTRHRADAALRDQLREFVSEMTDETEVDY